MYRYTVRCQFNGTDPEVIQRWLAWLNDPHISDVMKGGSAGAEVVKMSDELPTYEIRYQFPDLAAFQKYEAEFAPALKAEGLELFPPAENGMIYHRTSGEVVLSILG